MAIQQLYAAAKVYKYFPGHEAQLAALKTARTQLEEVQSVLSDRANWVKGSYARNGLGIAVRPASKEATCFCTVGATLKVCVPDRHFGRNNTIEHGKAMREHFLVESIIEDCAYIIFTEKQGFMERYYFNIPTFNDARGTTHKDIVQLLKNSLQYVNELISDMEDMPPVPSIPEDN